MLAELEFPNEADIILDSILFSIINYSERLEVFEKNELIVVKLFLEYCLKQCPIDEFEPRVTDGVKVINCKLAQANGGSTL